MKAKASERTQEMPLAAMAVMRMVLAMAAKSAQGGARRSDRVECLVTATYEDECGATHQVLGAVEGTVPAFGEGAWA
jgi:hypothetical protein